LLKLKINNSDTEMVFGSIYGPNDNNREFFDSIKRDLLELKCKNIVIGGDWNLTMDKSPVHLNIDCLNMRNIPSLMRTEHLLSICDSLNLTDPYRCLFPDKIEFTYVPNELLAQNRSRIDFFLVSTDLIPKISKCDISDTVVGRIFDHKMISLSTKKCNRKSGRHTVIKNEILRNPETVNKVRVTVTEFYYLHVNRDTVPGYEIANILEQCGRIHYRIKRINELKFKTVMGEVIQGRGQLVDTLRQEIEDIFDRLPDIDGLNQLELNCEPSSFFETLVM